MTRELFFAPPSHKALPPLTQDRPAYRILDERGFFCDDVLWPVGSIVYYDDEPNEQMEPLNDKARDAMIALIRKLDGFAEEVAKQTGKKFVSRAKDLEESLNQLRESARRVEIVQGDGGVPIMGAKRTKRRAQAVGEQETPETTAPKRRASIQAVE